MFSEKALTALDRLGNIIWGPWVLLMMLGLGLGLSVATRGFQLRRLPGIARRTAGSLLHGAGGGVHGLSPFQAVSTALAGTIGTGNVAGVATAIVAGGPGAVFWMWVSAFVGMMIKYAEVLLAVRFRERGPDGKYRGGPMEYMVKGLGARGLAWCFALFCMLSSLGTGSATQINTMAQGLRHSLGIPPLLTGAVTAALVCLETAGGLGRIGWLSERVVPLMALLYMAGGCVVLAAHRASLPGVLRMILEQAFAPRAAAGGCAGYCMTTALRYGISRGIFSNEAGLGSAPMAHGGSDAVGPVEQGMWGIFEVFVDTVVMCGFTALVVLSCGDLWQGGLDGAALTAAAFSGVLGHWGGRLVSLSMIFFAFSSILCWSYYGERAVGYLTGGSRGALRLYRAILLAVTVAAAPADSVLIWSAADLLNGLMALPNMIALAALSGEVVRVTRDWERRNPR